MVKTIEEISAYILHGQFELSRHAFTRMIERNISRQEFQESFNHAVLIEHYTTGRYLQSCLIMTLTSTQRPLHTVLTSEERHDARLFVITLYEPTSELWHDDWKTRL
jgi:Domain of unknown function (DUF4258)